MKAEVGKRYRHYKHGNAYTVVALARMEQSPDVVCVVYRAEYESPDFPQGTVWIRPQAQFEEQVAVDGKLIPRFSREDALGV